MNLTRYVGLPSVRARLDLFISTLPYIRPLRTTLLVESASANPSIVGTAYDYAVRIELARRARHARVFPWVAEGVLETRRRGMERLRARALDAPLSPIFESILRRRTRQTRQMERVLAAAKQAARPARRALRDPSPLATRKLIAAHAVRLAKIDLQYRAGIRDRTFGHAEPRLVREVAQLMNVTTLSRFLDPTVLILNPPLGPSAHIPIAADADIIAGDRLIEIKTTAEPVVERADVRQLLGYFLLVESARAFEPESLPRLRSLEIYYARYAKFVRFEADALRFDPDFEDTRKWFLENARRPSR